MKEAEPEAMSHDNAQSRIPPSEGFCVVAEPNFAQMDSPITIKLSHKPRVADYPMRKGGVQT
jgi:hypothetical protein